MKVLVANLGSKSFKYRLFDLPEGRQLARGGIDRIGQESSHCFVEIGDSRSELDQPIPDHAAAVRLCLDQLTDSEHGCLESVEEVSAIGFKAVHAAHLSGVRIVDDELLNVMQELFDIAPAHNPPYVKAMRQLREAFPQIPLVAALETAFHETIPPENRSYAIPRDWERDYGVKKWGFHGASHRYIAGRIAELTGREDLRVVSCHLGGSSSLCAIDSGRSKAASMGMTPQTGLPQNNRVGDFDPFALPYLIRRTGKSLDEVLKDLSSKGGLFGLSDGLSTDLRDLEEAAAAGNESAGLAIKTYVAEIRRYLGGYFALLGGCDAVVFTGGIGENSKLVRAGVCNQMEWAGLRLDKSKNRASAGESVISTDDSPIQVWTIPTNEEIVVARQTAEAVQNS